MALEKDSSTVIESTTLPTVFFKHDFGLATLLPTDTAF